MAHFFELNCLFLDIDSNSVYTSSRVINIDHISHWRSIKSNTYGLATEVWLDGEVCMTVTRDEHRRLRDFITRKGGSITYSDGYTY